jgi:hypothetical protein
MRLRIGTILVTALLCLAPSVSLADLAPYSQDFEGLLNTEADQPDQVALANDGWKVFVNVFGPDWSFWYNYGPFPAPNGGFGGAAFSAVVVGEGGPDQGDQQLVVFSDYNNGNHGDGSNAIIESNVFQEQIIGAADVGDTWTFEFDAKRGNIEGGSTAAAFFKIVGGTFIYIPLDMTNIPDTWDSYSLSITIAPEWVGSFLQFGFINFASNFEGSGIFYDNVNFDLAPLRVDLDIKPGGCPNPINFRARGVLPVALLGTMDFDVYDIDVDSLRLEGVAPIRSAYEDVAEPFAGDPCGCSEAGPDGLLDLTLKFDNQEIVNAIDLSASGDRVLTLTGTLLDGTPIEGQDCIVIVGVGGGRPNGVGREATAPRGRRLGNEEPSGPTAQDWQQR